MVRILVVEDEKPIANLVKLNLTGAGYACETVLDGADAAERLENGSYDLVLLDVMLPGLNGYELLEYCKAVQTPVIFLTARGQVAERVKGLSLGAEDYIVKPFEMIELLARVEVVLRRFHKTSTVLQEEEIVMDIESHKVTKNGEEVELTIKEYNLLQLFLRNKNIALFRETIFERVWDSDYLGDTRTVDLHVQRLRKKLGWEEKIRAVYKVGYRLEAKL